MSSTMYTPSHVANFLLDKSEEENIPLSQLKLIKLVYVMYGWVLATLDRRLFDEPIQAWRFGPVIPSLYHEFKHFKAGPIKGRSIQLDVHEGINVLDMNIIEPRIPHDDKALVILEKAWDVYKHFPAMALVEKTHANGTPWSKHYQAGVHNIVIPDTEIKEHFLGKIEEYISAGKPAA